MKELDFEENGIVNFSPSEIAGTGAKLEDVQLDTIMKLQVFRKLIGCAVVLLPNGMTTGGHKSPYHPAGKAVDFSFHDVNKVDVQTVFKCALTAGFTGFGAYHNGAAYSYHVDTGDGYRFWTGHKYHRDENWTFGGLIVDPKSLL